MENTQETTEQQSQQAQQEPEPQPQTRETKLDQALKLRDKLDSLLRRTVQTQRKCEKLNHDNRYLQDYVGNLMDSSDFLGNRV